MCSTKCSNTVVHASGLMAKRKARKTKAQMQRSELWQHSRTGPFQATASTVQQVTNEFNDRWARSSMNHFQPSNHNNMRMLLDTQHARSRVFGLQTASQFGYGIYDIDVELVASYDAVNPEDGRFASTQVRANYIEPTPIRMDALKHLKGLERLEDRDDAFNSVSSSNDNSIVNPLLAVGIDEDAETADGQASVKGQGIIRFTYSQYSPLVYANSQLSVDLNADDDVNDTYESQYYVLTGDHDNKFAILSRMESAVNPLKDGHRYVQHTWANPTNDLRVDCATFVQDQAIWSQNIKYENSVGTNLQGGIHTKKATFRGLRALGGLIELTVPEMFTSGLGPGGSANNDYELLVSVRCRKWIPAA